MSLALWEGLSSEFPHSHNLPWKRKISPDVREWGMGFWPSLELQAAVGIEEAPSRGLGTADHPEAPPNRLLHLDALALWKHYFDVVFCSFKSIFIMKFSFLVDTITTHIFTQTRNLGVILDSFFLISHVTSILSGTCFFLTSHHCWGQCVRWAICARYKGPEARLRVMRVIRIPDSGLCGPEGSLFLKVSRGVPSSKPHKGAR